MKIYYQHQVSFLVQGVPRTTLKVCIQFTNYKKETWKSTRNKQTINQCSKW